MRILFVSGTIVGGSGRSQRELAARLISRGHQVVVLADHEERDRVRRFVYEQLADLAARWGPRLGNGPIRWLAARPGRRIRRHEVGGVPHLLTAVPENAFPVVLTELRPDVVVGNSVLRLTWRRVRAVCAHEGIATVLYVREVASLNHLELGERPADEIVANASSLSDAVRQRGYDCETIPSVIEVTVTDVEPSRRAALLVNPIGSHGIDMLWELAIRLPDISFVIQESWPLTDDDVARLEERVGQLANVEFRRVVEPGSSLYADARVLLVPHRLDNRPRVIAEAQANGVPVIVSEWSGLIEATGDGGIVVGMDDVEGWTSAVRSLWSDPEHYESLVSRARAHSRRPEIDPAQVTSAVEALLERAVTARRSSTD